MRDDGGDDKGLFEYLSSGVPLMDTKGIYHPGECGMQCQILVEP